MELNEYRRNAIAKSIFSRQDLGGKSAERAINDASKSTLDKHDPLTEYIVDAIRSAEDTDDVESALNYAIDQLQKAKQGINNLSL